MTAQQDVINYINQQAGDPFTGAAGLAGFQLQINNALFASEAGVPGVPYRLSHAVEGRSSFSFGAVQWDVGAFETMNPPGSASQIVVAQSGIDPNASTGIRMLEQILRNAVDGTGSRIVSVEQVSEIINRLGISGELARNNPLALGPVTTDPVTLQQSVPLLDLVNRALNSAYGQNQINIWHGQHMADLEAHVLFVNQSVTDPARRAFLEGSSALQLFLADIRNQIDPEFSRDRLVEYLNSTGAAPVSVGTARLAVTGGSLGSDDVLNYYFGLPLNTPGIDDRLRRFNNDVTVAGGFSLSADPAAREEEAKGLIRVYQDFLKGRVSSTDFNTFDANVLELARVALIAQYVTTPGLGIVIDGEVVVGEDSTSHPRNTKHSSEHDLFAPLIGAELNDLILGESGSDELGGAGGNDVLYGGTGNDVLVGGLGNDYLDGGEDDDTYYYFAGDGFDTIVDSDGQGRIIYVDAIGTYHLLTGGRQVGAGSNLYDTHTAFGIQYNKEINGDLTILIGGVEAITIKNFEPPAPGGTAPTQSALSIVLEDLGGTLLTALTPVRAEGLWQSVILGDQNGPINDTFIADPITTQIAGNLGDDILEGRSGQDGYVQAIQLIGGAGNDTLIGESFYVGEFYGLGAAQFETVHGQLLPGIGVNALGGTGNDRFLGSLRDDFFDGGNDHDFADSYLGDDTLLGGFGNDLLNAHEGRDSVEGNQGNDLIGGGAGADHLQGGDGADQLYGDSHYAALSWDGFTLTLVSGSLTTGSFGVVRDVAESEAGTDILDGGTGDDELFGGAGDDVLIGGIGVDKLQGEGGDDFLFGGEGNDQLWGNSSADAEATDTELLPGDFGTITYFWRERHTGADGNDYLDGEAGDDQLFGGDGNDRLLGGIGDDTLYGGLADASPSGDDFLEGGDGNDSLFGEDGNDLLRGEAGADQLDGGAGDDTYVFNRGDGQDTITEAGGIDTLSFGEGILSNDVTVSPSDKNLVFRLSEFESITVSNWGASDQMVEFVQFSDGTVWDQPTIMANSGYFVLNSAGALADTGVRNNVYFLSPGTDTTEGFQIDIADGGGSDKIIFDPFPIAGSPPGAPQNLTPIVDGFARDLDDLVLSITLQSDLGAPDVHGTVHIAEHFTTGGIESVEFADGQVVITQIAPDANFTPGIYVATDATWPIYEQFDPTRTYVGMVSAVIAGTTVNDNLSSPFGPLSFGTYFYGNGSEDVFSGTGGDDFMFGGSTFDTFSGGAGNDTMHGGQASDTYEINLTDFDVIFDTGGFTPIEGGLIEPDELLVPNGIVLSDLIFVRDGNDLLVGNTRILRYFEPEASITTVTSADFFRATRLDPGDFLQIDYSHAIETVLGDTWALFNALPNFLVDSGVSTFEFAGTEGNDRVLGPNMKFTFFGLGGDDEFSAGSDKFNALYPTLEDNRIFGGTGNDELEGGGGNDWIEGEADNDILAGRAGDDTLLGGDGDDILIGDDELIFFRSTTSTFEFPERSSFLYSWRNNLAHNVFGRDVLIGGAGNDLLIGRNNGDTYRFAIGDGTDLIREFGVNSYQSFLDRVDQELQLIANFTGPVYQNNNWGLYWRRLDPILGSAPNQSNALVPAELEATLLAIGQGGVPTQQAFDALSTVKQLGIEYGTDVVEFGLGITPENITVDWTSGVTYTDTAGVQRSNVALLGIGVGASEGVVIESADVNPEFGVERFRFADGRELSLTEILALDLTPSGGIGVQPGTDLDDVLDGGFANDTLFGYAGNDILRGHGRDDLLFGGTGNDTLEGGAGDDVLVGESGDDQLLGEDGDNVLVGGSGADVLQAGIGNTVYAFNRGDASATGPDTVRDAPNDPLAPDTDTISFGSGIAPGDLDAFITDIDLGSGQSRRELTLVVRDTGERFDMVWSETLSDGTTLVTQDHAIERLQFLASGYDRIFDLQGLINARLDALLAASETTPAALFDATTINSFDITTETTFAGGDYALQYALTGEVVPASTNVIAVGDIGQVINAPAGNNLITAGNGNNTITTVNGNDVIRVGTGQNVINAGGGTNYIFTGGGNNTVFTGFGNDTINFGTGLNVVNFSVPQSNLGPIRTTIRSVSGGTTYNFSQPTAPVTNADRAFFIDEPTIDPSARPKLRTDVPFSIGFLSLFVGSLAIDITGTGDTIHFLNFDPNDAFGSNSFESFEFGDGTILTYSQVIDLGFDLVGTLNNDTLSGTSATDRITGSTGNDSLAGGAGDDSYFFNSGDGTDTVTDTAGIDTVVFGEGIGTVDVRAQQSGEDLIVSLNATDGIAFSDWYLGQRIEQFQFFDGSVLTAEDIEARVATNVTPTVALAIPDQLTNEDAPFSFTVPAGTFVDPDVGDVLSYAATLADGTVLPAWLTFDPITQTFGGTPTNDDVGSINVQMTATDAEGLSAFDEFALTVNNVNDAPTVANALTDQVATRNVAFSYTIPIDTFADVDAGDPLSYSASLADGTALPPWLAFDPITRTVLGTPVDGTIRSVDIRVTATDLAGASAFDDFSLTLNDAPVLALPLADQTATEDAPFSFAIPAGSVTDVDTTLGDSLGYTATLSDGSALPAWLTFDPVTQTFAGTPTNDEVGSLEVRVTATDALGASASDDFALTVINVNDAPKWVKSFGFSSFPLLEDSFASFRIPSDAFIDVDVGDTLSYLVALPEWLSFDSTTLTIAGTPTAANLGSDFLTVTVTDQAGATASAQLSLFVANTNDAPILITAVPDQNRKEGTAFFYPLPIEPFFFDEDPEDFLFYSAFLADGSALPQWLSFDPWAGIFSGTPQLGDAGVFDIRLTATDRSGESASDVFQLSVDPFVQPVLITGSSRSNTLTGTAGPDWLQGLGHNDTLHGNGGDDLLDGGSGRDKMDGGTGDDTYVVDNSRDSVTEFANEGIDTIESSISLTLPANVENLTLTGTSALTGTGNSLNNVLVGNTAANTLSGGAGHDTLDGGAGADVLRGSTGNDIYFVDHINDLTTEFANEGIDRVLSSVTFTLPANVEELTLTGSSAIDGTGNVLNNTLVGNSADNTLIGGDGGDVLIGREGNDILNAGNGLDLLIGGPGNDVYFISDSFSVDSFALVIENANEGIDTIVSVWAPIRLPANVENGISLDPGTTAFEGLYGNELDNVLIGSARHGSMNGGAGDDILDGRGGHDEMSGGEGNDTYIFGRGYDWDSVWEELDFNFESRDVVNLFDSNPLDVVFTSRGADLWLDLHGDSATMRVDAFYYLFPESTLPKYSTIDVFETADGSTLLSSQVDQLIQAMATFSAQNGGITWDQAIDERPDDVSAILAAHWQPAAA